MAIAFNEIPLSVNTPGTFAEFDSSRAVKGLASAPHTVLISGLMLATGTATAGAVTFVKSPGAAITLFGQHSPIAQAIGRYKAKDPLTEVFAVGLAEGSGTNAVGSFALTGTATATGPFYGYIGGRRIAVAVNSGDTASEVGDAFVTAHNLLTDSPVTVANTTGTVATTARLDGTYGNDIMMGHSLQDGEELPAGLACTVNAMATGATEPDYADLVTAMGEDWYNTLVLCTADATEIAKVVTELEDRWGPMRQIEGSCFVCKPDTQGNLTTYGNALNSHTLVVSGVEKSGLPLLPWEIAAEVAATDARQAQTDPARHLGTLLLPGIKAPPRGARFTRAERDTVLSDGISTTKAASDGRMLIERIITTYQTNGSGIADESLKDQTSVRTLGALRYSLRARIASKYGRHKLADNGNEIAGQPIVTPDTIRAEIIALFLEWQDQGWVENVEQFKDELLVERDSGDANRVNAIIPPDLINSFLVLAASVQFIR